MYIHLFCNLKKGIILLIKCKKNNNIFIGTVFEKMMWEGGFSILLFEYFCL